MARDWLGTSPQYWTEVEPLLDAMEANFSALATRYAALLPLVPKAALPFYRELVDSANITALRAKLVPICAPFLAFLSVVGWD